MYLCLGLSFLPDDDARCSHGSTLPDGADQIGLHKAYIAHQRFGLLAVAGFKLDTNVLIV